MYFAIIFHFFIGLFMYSNSTILTPSVFGTSILDYIDVDNEYFNPRRYANLHCLIFIVAFLFIVAFFLLRHTFFRVLCCCCKFYHKRAKYTGINDQVSDDFYMELDFYQLFKEFKKTKQEHEKLLADPAFKV